MILQADEIARRLRGEVGSANDPLVITPLPDLTELERSGAASVDLRLGTWFVASRARTTPLLDVGKPEDLGHTEAKFTKTTYIPFGGRYILHPGAFVLAVTLEWIRLPSTLAAYVTGKSSWGRRGLVIETAMGVHPRFSGCLTLELANVGEVPIAVRPGMLICQLFLHETSTPTKSVEQSSFVGYGRPILGRLEPDRIAMMLHNTSRAKAGEESV
jgi:dCTP deaminase